MKKTAAKRRSKTLKPLPVDGFESGKLALRGRVVCMDAARTVHRDGIVYIDAGVIALVAPATAEAPAEFAEVEVVDTQATLYPGLIELHNHLSYNVLPLWHVPKLFSNRDQWAGTPEYRKLVTAPMQVIGGSPELLPALVRYVECKCLIGGVTTTQGIALFSAAGIRRFYRGLVRNVEQSDQTDLPAATSRIPDVLAKDAAKFMERLRHGCLLLHLSEGRDDKARAHFLALHVGRHWAITKALVGIHCAALERQDFDVLAANGGSMVWSPLSNLLLYGKTADVKAARAAGVRMALGSDWSPTGSKNLLWELKVAKRAAALLRANITDEEIVAMATTNAAQMVHWGEAIGSLEKGKRADLLAIQGTTLNPYTHLIEAKESRVSLVVIGGVARFGSVRLMKRLAGTKTERLTIGNTEKRLNLQQPTADEQVSSFTLAHAQDTLRDAMEHLPELAKRLDKQPPPAARALMASRDGAPPQWFLALDEIEPTPVELRPKLRTRNGKGPSSGPTPVPNSAAALFAKPASEIVEKGRLDELAVENDAGYFDTLRAQGNLPEGLI